MNQPPIDREAFLAKIRALQKKHSPIVWMNNALANGLRDIEAEQGSDERQHQESTLQMLINGPRNNIPALEEGYLTGLADTKLNPMSKVSKESCQAFHNDLKNAYEVTQRQFANLMAYRSDKTESPLPHASELYIKIMNEYLTEEQRDDILLMDVHSYLQELRHVVEVAAKECGVISKPYRSGPG